MFPEQGDVFLTPRLFFLLGDIRQSGQLFLKGLREEVILGGDEITLAGLNQVVDGGVAVVQSGGGFLPLKFLQLSVVDVDLGEQPEVVLHVIPGVEGIFRQQNGQLGLDADGGGEGPAVELQPVAHQGRLQIGVQHGPGELLVFCEKGAVKLEQLLLHRLCVRHVRLERFQGGGSEGGGWIVDPIGGRIRQAVVEGDGVGGDFFLKQFFRKLVKGVLSLDGGFCIDFVILLRRGGCLRDIRHSAAAGCRDGSPQPQGGGCPPKAAASGMNMIHGKSSWFFPNYNIYWKS